MVPWWSVRRQKAKQLENHLKLHVAFPATLCALFVTNTTRRQNKVLYSCFAWGNRHEINKTTKQLPKTSHPLPTPSATRVSHQRETGCVFPFPRKRSWNQRKWGACNRRVHPLPLCSKRQIKWHFFKASAKLQVFSWFSGFFTWSPEGYYIVRLILLIRNITRQQDFRYQPSSQYRWN